MVGGAVVISGQVIGSGVVHGIVGGQVTSILVVVGGAVVVVVTTVVVG